MARQVIQLGTAANDGTGDPLRTAFTKVNSNFTELYNRPVFSGSYNDLTNKPSLFDGNYNNLSNKPTLFDGNYNSLSNKPTIPTDVSDLTDTEGLLGGGGGPVNQLVASQTENTFALMDEGDVVFDGDGPGGVNRGLVWNYGDNINGFNSTVRQDVDGLSVRAWTENGIGGRYAAPVRIVTNQGEDEKVWLFDGDGKITFPDGTVQTKSGTVANTIRGFINLVGDRPNEEDDCWFESVVVRGDYAYVLGGDWYIDNSSRRSKVYKFNLKTGEQELVRQIDAGRNAAFDLSVNAGVVSISAIASPGTGYIVNEKIYIRGDQINGSVPLNDITITVNTVNQTGGVTAASIQSGYNASGLSGTYSYITSYHNGASGYPIAINFDDDNNRLIVVSGYESGRGDDMDNYWDWVNVYTLNPQNLQITSVQTLSDSGDIYPNNIVTHPSGAVAIVGEKFNEYREFGNLAILRGGNGYFDILKSSIDPEHYPGSQYDYFGDFWVTGTGIATQENVDGVNYYTGLPTTVNEGTGSGATFYTGYDYGTGFTSFYLDATGSNYDVGDILTIAGTNFAGGTSPANDVEIEVTSIDGNGGVIGMQVIVDDIPTNALRIRVDNVDFSGSGTWSMRQNLGGEAFVWTPNWSNAIGGPSGDKFYGVCWNENATSLYAVGSGRYETSYDQALVVKFNASTGDIVWSKDIKFSQAGTVNRQARAVCLVPNSTDIMVAGAWQNPESNEDEIILTRVTDAGVAVWTKSYLLNYDGNLDIDYAMSIKPVGETDDLIVSFEQNTYQHNRGIGFLVVDSDGVVIRHRVLSADGNSNYNNYEFPTANFSDIYTDEFGDHLVVAAHTYVPTDNYYNALLFRIPVDGLKDIAINDPYSIGEHILNRFNVTTTTMTSAFESFTATEHPDTIVSLSETHQYVSRVPDALLQVWTTKITDDSAGYLEFGDGSKQSFATNIIPQVPAANDYYLTEQDSGKHIFFEHETGTVYIPHWMDKNLPVGFTFTIVNTTGGDCFVVTQGSRTGGLNAAALKLAGRNIETYTIGIPDSGSGSMVTFLKVKQGYNMPNSDGPGEYLDVWMVSGPGDIFNAD